MTAETPGSDVISELTAGHARLFEMARTSAPLPTAVVHPVDDLSLEGAVAAASEGLIEPLLVGPAGRIERAADEAGLDISAWEIVNCPHSDAAAARGVALVREGRAEALMKGALHTEELMKAVLHSELGLRTERRMSHCFVIDVPDFPKPFYVTDAAINIYPSLTDKRDIIQNAIDLAHALGVEVPLVAILSAVETVTETIRSTIDAAALCKMADRGQITGGVLDGPLAFDNAVSVEAAAAKGIVSPVAGRAQILVVPDLEAGNMLAKQLEYLAGAKVAGIVLGARVPIMLTSRADKAAARLSSAAIAVLLARHTARNEARKTK
jgi:phosphate acetyltransferase